MLSDAQEEDGMKFRLLFPMMMTIVSLVASGQTKSDTSAQTKNPVSSALREILTGRQKNIIAAVDEMPADKFSYKPTADQMTFGHLVTHIVEANNALCSKASGASAPKVEEVKDADAKDKLASALKASFDFCSEALSKMDDSNLGESTEIFGGQHTRAWAALVLSSSWADHYGMAAMYLRQNGLTPPTAKKK
jgi:uncharacterized damage-inducible protein DinB